MAKTIGFLLQDIQTVQFATFDESFTEDGKTELNTGLKFGIDEKEHLIEVIASVKFLQKKKPFLKLDIACRFTITDEAWNDFLKDKQIIIPVAFIRHLSVITIGTTRGVLHAKTENTPFQQFLLPAINVQEMITEDLIIDLKK